jgi:hypothetical protein
VALESLKAEQEAQKQLSEDQKKIFPIKVEKVDGMNCLYQGVRLLGSLTRVLLSFIQFSAVSYLFLLHMSVTVLIILV